MSLVAQFQSGAADLFRAMDDLAEAITIERTVTGSYNPGTSTHNIDPTVTASFAAMCIPAEFDVRDVGVSVQVGDVRVYVQTSDCVFRPEGDHKATWRGVVWGIQDVKEHGQTLYELQLRRWD